MSDPAPVLLLPPRPNLGPEPLPDSGRLSPYFLLAVILVGALLVTILFVRHRRRNPVVGQGRADVRPASGEPPSPRDRLIALSPSIRSALTRRFGSSCLAKTTEELASDHRIGDILGRADFEHLIDILNAIDRVKFSVSVLNDDDASSLMAHVEAWELSVRRLTGVLETGSNGG